jgi:hypothetical protein
MKTLIATWLAVLALSLLAFKEANSSQPPVGYSSAPGEGSCRSCHAGGTGPVTISLTQGGQPISTYTPGGGPITLQLTVSHSTAALYGFQLTALSSQAGQQEVPNQGLSTTGHTGVTLQTGGGGRRYVAHAPASATGNWTFDWTPPSTNIGPITWYVAANAANGNGGTSGDATAVYTLTLQPDLSSSLTASTTTASPVTYANGHWSISPEVREIRVFSLEGREVASYL